MFCSSPRRRTGPRSSFVRPSNYVGMGEAQRRSLENGIIELRKGCAENGVALANGGTVELAAVELESPKVAMDDSVRRGSRPTFKPFPARGVGEEEEEDEDECEDEDDQDQDEYIGGGFGSRAKRQTLSRLPSQVLPCNLLRLNPLKSPALRRFILTRASALDILPTSSLSRGR